MSLRSFSSFGFTSHPPHQSHCSTGWQADLATPDGKMTLTMLSAVVEMERDLLVERTQANLARAKKEGKTLGRPVHTTKDQRSGSATQRFAGYCHAEAKLKTAKTWELATVRPKSDAP